MLSYPGSVRQLLGMLFIVTLTWKLHIKEEKIVYCNFSVLNPKPAIIISLKTLSDVFNLFGLFFIYKCEKGEHLNTMVFLWSMGRAGAMKRDNFFPLGQIKWKALLLVYFWEIIWISKVIYEDYFYLKWYQCLLWFWLQLHST